MRILSVVGARPNFMKLAPLDRVLRAREAVDHVIVHTGQHYDAGMSESFFRDLRIPKPDFNLEVGSASHAQQTAAIMERFEPLCIEPAPDLVLVYGDVNSTVAAALVAAKLGVRVGHVEAGLRSGDWTMPEEINRVVTDRLADLLFTPSRDADENLFAEGVPAERIHFVGNIMIDTLVEALPAARRSGAVERFGLEPERFVVATLHRPSNVDDPEALTELVAAIIQLSEEWPVVFPVHPRTRQRLIECSLVFPANANVQLVEPIGYLEMLGLVSSAGLVLTDSGGVQEETSFLGVPCVTVRPNTERPVTVTHGTNRLAPSTCEGVLNAVPDAIAARTKAPPQIERWDGKTAERIAEVILS